MTSSPEGEGGVSQKMTNDDMMTEGAVGMQKKSVLYLLYNCFLFRVQKKFVLFFA